VPVCAYGDEKEFLDYVWTSNFGQQASIFAATMNGFARLIDPMRTKSAGLT